MRKHSPNQHKRPFFSIKAKVTFLATLSILLSVTIISVYQLNVSRKAIMNATEIAMQELSASYSANLAEAIRQASEAGNFMMTSASVSGYVDSEGQEYAPEIQELAAMFLSMNTTSENISLVNKDGIVLYSSDDSLTGKDLSKEAYFTSMVDSGLSAQGDVFTSDSSGDACVTLAIPLRTDMQVVGQAMSGIPMNAGTSNATVPADGTAPVDGTAPADTMFPSGNADIHEQPVTEFTGAIVTDVKVSEFTGMLSEVSIGDYESGYTFILDSNGTYVYHPTEELIGTQATAGELKDVMARINAGNINSQIINFNEDGAVKYAGYSVNEDNHWTLFIAADQKEVLADLNSVVHNSIIASILLSILLSLAAYLTAGKITKSIQGITRLINKTAELDFTVDPAQHSLSLQRDETGEMSRAIEKMRSALSNMISRIREVSGEINTSSDRLNAIAISVHDHASDNSATAQELSASMEETAATTQQIHAAIEQIENTSGDITGRTALGTQLSAEIIRRAGQLKSETDHSTLIARKLYEEVKEKTDLALAQSKAVEKINLLVKAIKDIAGKTNLLSLNASIEAARAGEAGAGFAVVASEIGSLAQQSSHTVQGISEIVDEVYQAVDHMALSLKQTLEFLERNVLVNYQEFSTSSEQYHSDAKAMNDTMENIQKQIEVLNTNLSDISASIAEIDMMVNEASKGVNDVAEKNTDIVALTNDSQTKAQDNTGFANSLKEMMDQFKL